MSHSRWLNITRKPLRSDFAQRAKVWMPVFVGMTCVLWLSASAQAQTQVSQGQSWDAIKQLPDWDGVWASFSNGSARGMKFTAAGKAQNDNLTGLRGDNGDVPSRHKKCILAGFPSGMTGPEQYTIEFVYTPGRVTITDSQAFVRRIFTDGRRHHQGPLTLMGDSVGHWERDAKGGYTLVVDTISLDPGNELFYGFMGEEFAHHRADGPQRHGQSFHRHGHRGA